MTGSKKIATPTMAHKHHSFEAVSQAPQFLSPISFTSGDKRRRRSKLLTTHRRRTSALAIQRIPSYYDAPVHESLDVEPVHGGRQPIATVRRMLCMETISGSTAPRPISRTLIGEQTECFEGYASKSSLSPRTHLQESSASCEGEADIYKNMLIRISPSITESGTTERAIGDTHGRTLTFDLFRRAQKGSKIKQKRQPGGLYRVVQSSYLKLT